MFRQEVLEESPDDETRGEEDDVNARFIKDAAYARRPGSRGRSPRTLRTGLVGAELILRRSSWMLLASLMREGCRVKPRLVPGDEKSFLAQLSTDARESRRVFLVPVTWDVELAKPDTRGKCREAPI